MVACTAASGPLPAAYGTESTEYVLQTMQRSWPDQAYAALQERLNSLSRQNGMLILAGLSFDELSETHGSCNGGRAFGLTTELSRGGHEG